MEQHSFGYWLRLKRKALDLTREELAKQVGYSAATLRKIEDEERHPSAQVVERLAEVFKIPQNERADFLRFARGDLKSAPVEVDENLPWRAPGNSPRSNIPATTTSLIAREKEIDLVREYLSSDDIRLVTLMGPPGIGKTRLSIEAARASLHDFPDGVFFVPLALLDDPNSIPSAIIPALGYMESGRLAPEDQLKEGIGQKRMLIVLDNCEHLIEGVAAIASRLLSACPRLKMLATSRESFRIAGEWLYLVPAFDIPKESESIDLDNASDFPALMLFVERARAVRSDFKLTTDNIQTIAAICAHLDGLPLVIELIAAAFYRWGQVAQYLGSPARTVSLFWAAKNAHDTVGMGVWSQGLDAEFSTVLERCRDALGETAYAEAVERGRAMTMEQAIAYALEE